MKLTLFFKSSLFNQLFLLNEQANDLFLEMLELSAHNDTRLPKELSEALKEISKRIEIIKKEKGAIDFLPKEINGEYQIIRSNMNESTQ